MQMRLSLPRGDGMSKRSFDIKKADEEKQIVFGWASVAIREDGTIIEDYQHDVLDIDELEKAAYQYVLDFRNAGEVHDPARRKKGKLIESVVLTSEKQAAMGIPPGTVPIGWWIGFKVTDPQAWEKIKSGEYRMFSVEGVGKRVPVKKDRTAVQFKDLIQKYNPHHDAKGRFASAKGQKGHTQATPMALVFTEKGDPYGVYGNKVKDESGFYSVVMHGTKEGFGTKDPDTNKMVKTYTPEELCDIIKKQKDYKGGAIKLFSCETGAEGAIAAQNVSNIMGVQVKAPNGFVWIKPDGNYFVTRSKNVEDVLPPDSSWNIFMPEDL